MWQLQDPHPSPLPERAALSFLGVGTPPDMSSWGGMLSITGQKHIKVSPWLVFFPSLAVSIAVFGFKLLEDTLRGCPRSAAEGLAGTLRRAVCPPESKRSPLLL
jgi:hypothetical protein